jgi:hypothetical protein
VAIFAPQGAVVVLPRRHRQGGNPSRHRPEKPPCAGNYRTGPVFIAGTTHQPPPAHEVAERTEELCDYVNSNWDQNALHLSAYVM